MVNGSRGTVSKVKSAIRYVVKYHTRFTFDDIFRKLHVVYAFIKFSYQKHVTGGPGWVAELHEEHVDSFLMSITTMVASWPCVQPEATADCDSLDSA